MTTPPKYEELVLKVAEMERREAALREELEVANNACSILNDLTKTISTEKHALQQRLTVAEKRSAELEELLRDINDAPGGSQFKKHIDAALKPAAEGEGS